MKEALQHVINTFPYNSFGKMYVAEGQQYPEQFGGNCAFLTRKLIEKLLESGTHAEFLWNKERTHWASICREGGSQYYLDPILLHHEPINLTKLEKTRGRKQYDAFPIVDGNPTKVDVTSIKPNHVRVEALGFKRNGYECFRSYEYDIRDVTTTPPSDWEQLRDTNPNTFLRMKVLESPEQATSLFLTSDGLMHIKQLSKPKVHQEKDPDKFWEITERISQHLRTNTDTLIRFFYRGQRLYRDRAGKVPTHAMERKIGAVLEWKHET